MLSRALLPSKYTKGDKTEESKPRPDSQTQRDTPASVSTVESPDLSPVADDNAPSISAAFPAKLSDHAIASVIADTHSPADDCVTTSTDHAIYCEIKPSDAISLASKWNEPMSIPPHIFKITFIAVYNILNPCLFVWPFCQGLTAL